MGNRPVFARVARIGRGGEACFGASATHACPVALIARAGRGGLGLTQP